MSASWETASLVVGYRRECQDRVAVLELGERTIIVVADGAGGSGDGSAAAEAVIREVRASAASCTMAAAWQSLLTAIDLRIGSGESTAVVVDLQPDKLCGASVGDSRAWLIDYENVTDLTREQVRKPLLGSGEARSVGFELNDPRGTLLVSTDGLFNYIKAVQVTALLTRVEFFEIPRALVELVRLPSGDLWDDIGIVACRRKVTPKTRRKYEIP